MNFLAIPKFVLSSQLNEIDVFTLGTVGRFELIRGNDLILADHFNSNRIYGLGDVMRIVCEANQAVDFTLFVFIGEKPYEREFTVIPSKLLDSFDFSLHFLNFGDSAAVPPGAEFSLSAIIDDLKNQPNFSADFDCSFIQEDYHPYEMAVSFRLPEKKGVYHVSLGNRIFNFFVVDMPKPVCIEFKNHLNAHDFLYLPAQLTSAHQRTASIGRLMDRLVEYDVKSSLKIDLTASNVDWQTMRKAMILPLSNDIRINGNAVAVSDFETKISKHSKNAYDLKFSAQLKEMRMPSVFDIKPRVFTDEYNYVFD